ncbi:MAG: transposase [Deltaproteobacteria bacterium]|nr:MAG: transposase [Deltaproteobacteria bacterium]
MARPPRLHFTGAFYHVIVRGNQRQNVFRNEADYQKYQVQLAHYQSLHKFILHAYVLMPNHVHLLIEVGSIPLSKTMQGLQFTYTQYFNRKYKTVGHLFQGRYKAILCDKENYLIELVRYIHLNPVRAKLVKKPEEYRWSSYPVYLGSRKETMLVTDFVLEHFGRNKSAARIGFRKFVMERVTEKSREDLYEVKLQTVLGSDDFIETLPMKSQEEKVYYQITQQEIVEALCRRFKIKEDELSRFDRGRRAADVRHRIGYIAKELVGMTYGSVAQRFGREAISFSIGVRRMAERIKHEPELNREMESICQEIIKGKKKIY